MHQEIINKLVMLPIGSAFNVFKPFQGNSYGIADCRTFAGRTDFQPVKNRYDCAVIAGQGYLGIGMGPENHHADPVAAAPGHKFPYNPPDRFKAVHDFPLLPEIKGCHAFGKIDRKDDIDTFGPDVLSAYAPLGPCHGDNEQGKAHIFQDRDNSLHPEPGRTFDFQNRGNRGYTHDRTGASAVFIENSRRNQGQQKQKTG